MRIINGAVATMAIALLLGSVANAQDETPKRFFVHVGVSRANNGDVRDATQETGIAAGAGYLFASPNLIKNLNATESIDLDFLRSSGNGNSLQTAGLAYTVRIPIGEGQSSTRPYYGIGLGFYRSEAKEDTSGSSDKATKTNFGGKLLVGANIGGSAFVEASYLLSGKVEDVKTDTVNLTVGLRF